MIKLDVQFYSPEHEKLLQSNCDQYAKIKALVNSGFDVESDVLLSYAIFQEQKFKGDIWETYKELQEKLPPFKETWQQNYDFSKGTIHAKCKRGEIEPHHIEALGVGGALSFVSHIYGLTEADWEKVKGPSQVSRTDFKIASTGDTFVEVEAKGIVVPEHNKKYVYDAKSSIEKKKKAQRDNQNKNTMLGVVTAIPYDNNLIARCYILDPPPETISLDPFKYKLLARLYFYWRELCMLSRAHFLEDLINRIKAIQSLHNDYKLLDGLPLLNRKGDPHVLPQSLFKKRSTMVDNSVFGEVMPLGRLDNKFIFYGFETKVVETLLMQDFKEITTMSSKVRVQENVEVLCRIIKRPYDKTVYEFPENEEEDLKPRKSILMKGNVCHTPCGRVLGLLEPK